MANFYLVPLTNIPQRFEITLAGVIYTLTVKWNAQGEVWILDISDSNNNPIVHGIPMVTGDDLLDGLAYLGINGQLFVFTSAGKYPDQPPNIDNLGTNSNLYFFTDSTDE